MDKKIKAKFFKEDVIVDMIDNIIKNDDVDDDYKFNNNDSDNITYPMWKNVLAKNGETYKDYLKFISQKNK